MGLFSWYCTLDDAKDELKATSVNATQDPILLNYVRTVSRRIDSIMNPRGRRPYFWPYTEQKAYEIRGYRVNSALITFDLKEYLMSFSEVLVDGSDYTSDVEAYPLLSRPITMLRLTDVSKSWYDVNDNAYPPRYTKVTGEWGYHSDIDNALQSVDTVQNAGGINASVTSLTVADIDGADVYGFTPRLSAGSLIKIGSEYMLCTATNTTTNVATIVRGQLDTTAAAHANGVAVQTFIVEEPIRRVTARQAATLYARRGAFQTETVDAAGTTAYPQDLIDELRNVLLEYMYG